MERECVDCGVGYPQYDFRLSKKNICALWRCRPMPKTSVLLDMAKIDQNGGIFKDMGKMTLPSFKK